MKTSTRLLSAFCGATLCSHAFSPPSQASPAAAARKAVSPARKLPPIPAPALDIIQRRGALALVEGQNYYLFERGGVFRSGPTGMSGRTLFGFWKSADSSSLEVVARQGWVNGLSAIDDFRRISFYIAPGSVRVGVAETAWMGAAKPIYRGYWFIEALEKTRKPADFEAREARFKREHPGTYFE